MSDDFPRNPNVMAIVRLKDGQTSANSQDVAAFFGKRHDSVLLKYDNLDCSEAFRLHNFMETSTSVPMPNGGTRKERAFDMTRDGFVFIAFGFTGQRAAKFKEDYIAAFNAMEAEIGRRTQIQLSPAQASLALAVDTNDSLANIDRHLHAIHTGLGAKVDALASNIIGAIVRSVGRPILDHLEKNQRWNEMRFEAMYRRDKLLIQSLAAKQDAEECVSIAVAQTMMGVSSAQRSSRLSRNLSANAVRWFVSHGYTARPDASHESGAWVFQRSKITDWWNASGKAIFDRELQSRSTAVVSLLDRRREPAA